MCRIFLLLLLSLSSYAQLFKTVNQPINKFLTCNNSLIFSGVDGSTLNIGSGGTLGTNAFSSTTFAPLNSPSFTGTVTYPTPFILGAISVTSTGTQLNYLNTTTGITGSGKVVLDNTPTLLTPTIASFANSAHNHSNSAGGGQISLTNAVTGVLPIVNGGTNQSTYITGDQIYASATNTLSKQTIGTTGQIQTVSGGIPVWASTIASTITATTQSQNDNSTKISTTAYTDLAVSNALAGINPAVSVQAATTANVSGYTYNNGASGIGATLTQNSAAIVVIDGYTLLLNDRVLFKDQSTGANNGVYVITTLGTGLIPAIFTRASDYNQPSDINNTGAIPVINGTVNATTSWVQTANVVAVGTTALVFTEFSLAPSSLVTLTGSQALTNKTYNGNTWTAGTGTLSIGASKTFTVNNTLTFSGTDGTTMTFPSTSGTVATTSQIKDFTYGSGQSYASTTTTTDEVAYSLPIAAGTIANNALLEIRALLTPSASTNTKNFKVWLSTASETVGTTISGSATQIMLYNSNGGTSTSVGIYREFGVRSLTSITAARGATSSLSNDVGNLANTNTVITIPTLGSNTWLVFTVERANGADTFTSEFCYGYFRNL